MTTRTSTMIAREMRPLREARIAPIRGVLEAAHAQMLAAVVEDGSAFMPDAREHLLYAAALLAILAERTLACEDCGHNPCDCDMYRWADEVLYGSDV